MATQETAKLVSRIQLEMEIAVYLRSPVGTVRAYAADLFGDCRELSSHAEQAHPDRLRARVGARPHARAIPTEGAPSASWIIRSDNRGMAGLGFVEWLEPLRTNIKRAIHVFQPRHPVWLKGSRIGPTHWRTDDEWRSDEQPFLDGMTALAASDRVTGTPVDNTETTMTGSDIRTAWPKWRQSCAHVCSSLAHTRQQWGRWPNATMLFVGSKRWLTSFENEPGADMMTAKHAGIDPVAHWQDPRRNADGAWHDRARNARDRERDD